MTFLCINANLAHKPTNPLVAPINIGHTGIGQTPSRMRWSPRYSVYTPKMENITNARLFRSPSGVLLFSRYPTIIPRISAANNPREQASQTISAALIPSFAPKVMAVSCVLSPSSATKNVQKTARGAN